MNGRAAPTPNLALSLRVGLATPGTRACLCRASPHAVRRVRQRGQALILALLLMALGGVAWVALYNIGQTTSARIRLTHVADAVAYSGAVAQARSLNTLAYINRAHVAHQVAMAYLVTLSTWAQYEHTQSQQRRSRNPPSSLIRRLFGTAAGKSYAQAGSTDDAMPNLARAFQEHDDVVHQVLQQASVSVAASLTAMRGQMMQRVLQANYPEYEQGEIDADAASLYSRGPFILALVADGATGYVKRHSGRDAGRLRHTVEHAVGRYDFLRRRDRTHRNDWVIHSQCPSKRHELRRRGRTWLTDDGRWSSQDSLSFHALRANRWIGCHFREYAMGWGRNSHHTAPQGSNPPRAFAQQDFWRWVHEHTSWDLFAGRSNPLAKAYASSSAVQWAGRGLPDYYDLPEEVARHPLSFGIALRQSAASLPSMNNARASRHLFPYHGALSANEFVTVHSAAQTYFAPPAQLDGDSTLATLFRPYWQARLSPLLFDAWSEAKP